MYKYYINKRELSRKDFKDIMAETICADLENLSDGISISVANYTKAENKIISMQKNSKKNGTYTLLTRNGAFKVLWKD